MGTKVYNGYKPFQEKLYEESDRRSKRIAADFLESTGKFELKVPVELQKEEFSSRDFQILHIPTNTVVSVEVEQKLVWTSEGRWQPGYGSGIDIPYRKIKSKANLFIMLNKYFNTLITIPMEEVKASSCIKKDTKIKRTNTKTKKEQFFRVLLTNKKLRMYHKQENTWVRTV